MLTQSLLVTGLAALVVADKQNNPYGTSGGYGNRGSGYSPQRGYQPQAFGDPNGGRFPQQNRGYGGNYQPLQWGGNGGGYPQRGGGYYQPQQGGGGYSPQNWGGNNNNGYWPTDDGYGTNNQQQQQQQQQQTTDGTTQQQQQQQQQSQSVVLNINTAPTGTDPSWHKPDITLNRLVPYSQPCTQLEIDPQIDITVIDIDIKKITCQAFTDAQGQQPIGSVFGYENPCDLGQQPVQVGSILCSEPQWSGDCNSVVCESKSY